MNFNLPWSSYRDGFGNPSGNYWMGLEHVYRLTSSARFQLRIEMELMSTGQWLSVGYDSFKLESEVANYTIHVSGYQGGLAGDVLNYQINGNTQSINGNMFSTFDRDNDRSTGSCAGSSNRGGFWYNSCAGIGLTGAFNTSYNGLYLNDSLPWTSLSSSRMMMRLT